MQHDPTSTTKRVCSGYHLQIVAVARKDVARRVLVLELEFVGLSLPGAAAGSPASVRGFVPCRPFTKLEEFRFRTNGSGAGAWLLDPEPVPIGDFAAARDEDAAELSFSLSVCSWFVRCC